MASNVGTVNVNLAYGRCRDCKWWDFDAHIDKRDDESKHCDHPNPDFAADQPGGIWTMPTFGCIHFEEK